MSDLLKQLTDLATHQHSDLSVALDARDEIERLSEANARLTEKDAALTQCRGLLKQNTEAVGDLRARLAKIDGVLREWGEDMISGESAVVRIAKIVGRVTDSADGREGVTP